MSAIFQLSVKFLPLIITPILMIILYKSFNLYNNIFSKSFFFETRKKNRYRSVNSFSLSRIYKKKYLFYFSKLESLLRLPLARKKSYYGIFVRKILKLKLHSTKLFLSSSFIWWWDEERREKRKKP